MVSSHQLEAALKQYFGFSAFRGRQRDIIANVVAGHDTMIIMPTGAGKSLCYRLPALIREGITLVVSPLVALMKDQVDALVRRGIAATTINSSVTASEQRQRLIDIGAGDTNLYMWRQSASRLRLLNECVLQMCACLPLTRPIVCLSGVTTSDQIISNSVECDKPSAMCPPSHSLRLQHQRCNKTLLRCLGLRIAPAM